MNFDSRMTVVPPPVQLISTQFKRKNNYNNNNEEIKKKGSSEEGKRDSTQVIVVCGLEINHTRELQLAAFSSVSFNLNSLVDDCYFQIPSLSRRPPPPVTLTNEPLSSPSHLTHSPNLTCFLISKILTTHNLQSFFFI